MNPETTRLFTQVHPVTKIGKIIQFPATRILIALIFLLPATMIHNFLYDYFIENLEKPLYYFAHNAERIFNFLLFYFSYRLYVKYIERRPAYEISVKGALPEFGNGTVIGGSLISVAVAAMAIPGYYQITGFDSAWWLLNGVFQFGIGSFLEELIFRLILFRLLEELTGTWISLVAISLLFGFMHLGNENASVWSSISITLEDLIIVGIYMTTRRLWMVWGLHFGWNYFQDGIFGLPNSGETSFPGWINPTVEGPEWFTGGSFGIEASVVIILLTVAGGIYLLVRAYQKGLIISPRWRRKAPVAEITA
ncbi:MAG: CPBP family intramembrane glutamic endopeptidase [Candidatus Zixiibacteriota bacterium]